MKVIKIVLLSLCSYYLISCAAPEDSTGDINSREIQVETKRTTDDNVKIIITIPEDTDN